MRGALGEECGRGAVTAGAVFTGEVEAVLVGGDGGEEERRAGEVLQVEALGLDGGVAAFDVDVGVGVGAGGRIEAVARAGGDEAAVEAVGAVVDGVAVELAAQIGAHLDLGQVEAVGAEVREDAGRGERGVGFRAVGGVGEEERAGGFVADRVLERGQRLRLQLRPVVGNIGEILGVHLQATERRVGGLDGVQIGFAAVLAGPRADEFFVPQDAVRGAFADGQLEPVHQAPRAEAGRFFPRGDDEFFLRGAGAAGLAVGAAGMVGEPLVAPAQRRDHRRTVLRAHS